MSYPVVPFGPNCPIPRVVATLRSYLIVILTGYRAAGGRRNIQLAYSDISAAGSIGVRYKYSVIV